VSDSLAPEISGMAGEAALPRANGALVFAAPWQGRAFGTAVAAVQGMGLEWEDFRVGLIAAITSDPDRPYYDSWVAALEALVVSRGLATEAEVQERAGRQAAAPVLRVTDEGT
jgi:nitrile hydratase accessory protein